MNRDKVINSIIAGLVKAEDPVSKLSTCNDKVSFEWRGVMFLVHNDLTVSANTGSQASLLETILLHNYQRKNDNLTGEKVIERMFRIPEGETVRNFRIEDEDIYFEWKGLQFSVDNNGTCMGIVEGAKKATTESLMIEIIING